MANTANKYLYFLLNSGIVVYIGQTSNFAKRAKHHVSKVYDAVRIISCDTARIDYYEHRWIRLFKPKYNYAHNPVRKQRNHGSTQLIHHALWISEIARRYYEKATGEQLTNQEAVNRWRMLRNPDRNLLRGVIKQVAKEADKEADKEVQAS